MRDEAIGWIKSRLPAAFASGEKKKEAGCDKQGTVESGGLEGSFWWV